MTPNTRNASSLPVRVVMAEPNQDFETAVRLAKQTEQRELEMKKSISNDTSTGTTREQQDGNASYQEILDVLDYEVQPPDSFTAKSFARARPFIGAQAPAGALANTGEIARILGSPEEQ